MAAAKVSRTLHLITASVDRRNRTTADVVVKNVKHSQGRR
jgi:hypothetical protein